MDVKELKAFVCLTKNLNFSLTAKQCAMSSSALSRTINRIENELNTTLFIRNNKTVTLTEAGKLLLTYAQNTLQNYDYLKTSIQVLKSPIKGKLKLYCSVTASMIILPNILNNYRNKYPDVEIKIETGDAAQGIEKVLNNEVDISIAAVPKKLPSSLFAIELLQIPLVFIAPKQIPKAWIENNNLNLNVVPYIISEQGELRKEFNNWVKKENIKPHIYAEIAGNEAIVSMVALGLGIALVPKAVAEQSILKDSVQIIFTSNNITNFKVSLCGLNKNLIDKTTKSFVDLVCSTKQ